MERMVVTQFKTRQDKGQEFRYEAVVIIKTCSYVKTCHHINCVTRHTFYDWYFIERTAEADGNAIRSVATWWYVSV